MMPLLSKASGLLAALILISQTTLVQSDARTGGWHLDNIAPLVIERLDPVVSPNQVSGHVHRINGMPSRCCFLLMVLY